jgi:hypothetical protein
MAATSARQAGRVAANDSDLEPGQRRIALVAHDGRKQDMREWAEFNRDLLTCHQLYAAETTGRMLGEELGLPATRFTAGRRAVEHSGRLQPGDRGFPHLLAIDELLCHGARTGDAT